EHLGHLAAVGGDLLANHHAAPLEQQVVQGAVHAAGHVAHDRVAEDLEQGDVEGVVGLETAGEVAVRGGVHHGVHEVLELVDLLVGDPLDHPRGDRDLEHLPRLGDLGDGHHAGPQHQLEDVAAAAVEGGGDQYVAAAL